MNLPTFSPLPTPYLEAVGGGEHAVISTTTHIYSSGTRITGSLHVTMTYIAFSPHSDTSNTHYMVVPLNGISKVLLSSHLTLVLRGGAGKLSFGVSSRDEALGLLDTLRTACGALKHAARSLPDMSPLACALASKVRPAQDLVVFPGWDAYDPVAEFETRMGVLDGGLFRRAEFNADYAAIPSYPGSIYVPSGVEDDVLLAAAQFRGKGRIPALVWKPPGQPGLGPALFRSGQPGTGLVGHRSDADEQLVGAMRRQNPDGPFVIIDARPYVNATLNQAKGYGTEKVGNYGDVSLEFMGIDNIHVMRDSMSKLVSALASSKTATRPSEWYARIADSGWLDHVSRVLAAASRIVSILTVESGSVLVHCSDGWDRTPQLSALAQVLLDPFYRTKSGFAVLVEKEWLSFGHKFADRTSQYADVKIVRNASNSSSSTPGLIPNSSGTNSPAGSAPDGSPLPSPAEESTGSSVLRGMKSWGKSLTRNLGRLAPDSSNSGGRVAPTSDESPIFLQFLDCCAQIHRQFPWAFAFSESFLVELADAVYSDVYGTFLQNFVSERTASSLSTRSLSVWETLLEDGKHNNPLFTGDVTDSLIPNSGGGWVHLWDAWFSRVPTSLTAPKTSSSFLTATTTTTTTTITTITTTTAVHDDDDDDDGDGDDDSSSYDSFDSAMSQGHVDDGDEDWDFLDAEGVERTQQPASSSSSQTAGGEGTMSSRIPVRWVPDSEAKVCAGPCGRSFGIKRRKHHCRRCGRVFCNPCSSARAPIPGMGTKYRRVCLECHDTMFTAQSGAPQ